MKKKINILLSIIMTITFARLNLESSSRGKPIISGIKSGSYLVGNIITIKELRGLPIPKTKTDYAFYQAINNVSNVVIGKFSAGDRVITLITDTGTYDEKQRKTDDKPDGKVDLVVHWYVDLKKIAKEPNPDKYCSVEKFAKMKEEILSGESDTIYPNKEGLTYLRELLKKPSNIQRVQYGYRVSMADTDEPTKERVIYFYSHSDVDGASMAFEVKYNYVGLARLSPIINYTVYCKRSRDPFAIEQVKKLVKETKEVSFD